MNIIRELEEINRFIYLVFNHLRDCNVTSHRVDDSSASKNFMYFNALEVCMLG